MSKRTISLGAFEPLLAEQLSGLLPKLKLDALDDYASCITRLHVFGMLTDAECDRARQRLIKKIQALLNTRPAEPVVAREGLSL